MKKRARRSLKASPVGISRANNALLKFESKIAFAAQLGISRATVQKFFAGQLIGSKSFHQICQKLELPWQAIADLPNDNAPAQKNLAFDQDYDIDALVQEVRQKEYTYIQFKCGSMRVLDMSQPIGLNDIYTNVYISERISRDQALEVKQLLKVCMLDEFDRPNFGRVVQDRVLGVEAVEKYSKLMLLGNPGAGKTTFLKYVATQCNSGQLQAHLVPILIALKDFSEVEQQTSLLKYITQQFDIYGISETKIVQYLLTQGRCLILLDGLDEVKETDSQRVLESLNSFLAQFPSNHFIITCRVATKGYAFKEFIEAEIAYFTDSDIASFVNNWFAAKDPIKSIRFIQKLKVTNSIRELATNPLMLTLLCLIFEESADFPANRSELYKEGLEIVLKKWDAQRNIKRQIYKTLSLQHKTNILSKIAFITFARGEYFFRRQEIEQHIANYIYHLPGLGQEDSALQLESAAILKSIETQHGLLVERAREIYSFSHLTFQEYFTAREIVASSDPQVLDIALKRLVSHITDKRWREIFLLTVGMLRTADYLLQLMKQKIDELIAEDPELQDFISWVNQKYRSVSVSYKPATVRAFYFDLAIARILALFGSSLDLARLLNQNLTRELEHTLALDLALDRTLALDQVVERSPNPHLIFTNVLERAINHAHAYEPQLERELQQLKKQLPEVGKNKNKFKQWWKVNGYTWTNQLRCAMISARNIGHNWQLSKQQKETLKQYYDANQLLVECLKSNNYVTQTARFKIEQTLLLPMAEISRLTADFGS